MVVVESLAAAHQTCVLKAAVGPTGNVKFMAVVDGKILRGKNGVGRLFQTPEAAQKVISTHV